MKTKVILSGILCLFTSVLFAQQNKLIELKQSIINWTGHAEVGTYSPAGTLNFKDGTVTLLNGAITAATLVIDMKSMKQDNATLLEHLKSDDFFDVEKYPASSITINKVNNGVAYGQLTIKNKSLPFNCAIIVKKDKSTMTITGNATIDRTQYGIIYNSGSFFSNLGDKAIKNTFDIGFKIVLAE